MNRNSRGFTLIELMIVVVIIGVLTSLAYVRYHRVVREAKLREAAIALAYLWDIQYAYYLEHGEFIYQQSPWGVVVFDLELGFDLFDEQNEEMLSLLGYDPPSGKSHFWYVSYYWDGGLITRAYPKLEDSGYDFPEDEIDEGLRDISLVVDNDRRIYVYGDGHIKQL